MNRANRQQCIIQTNASDNPLDIGQKQKCKNTETRLAGRLSLQAETKSQEADLGAKAHRRLGVSEQKAWKRKLDHT